MKAKHKKIITRIFLILLVISSLGFGVYGLFSSSVSSTNNQFELGTITLDGGNGNGVAISPIYSKTNAVPGDSGATATSCPLIQNTGSVAVSNGNFKVYAGTLTGTPDTVLTNEITITIQRGTGTLTNCSDFAPSTTIYTGTLTNFSNY